MNVFCDYHHAGLYHSIHKWFVEKAGAVLFRPIGLEWATMGIWQYSQNLAIQRQYLDMIGLDGSSPNYYTQFENSEGIQHKLLTFEQFQKMPIDIIVSTVSEHELPFVYLQKKYKPEAKVIRVIGNCGEQIDWTLTRNLIDTTDLYKAPEGVNRVVLHQPFDLETFYYEPVKNVKKIKTFVNCFSETPFYDIYERIRERMPDFVWEEHGHLSRDGFVTPVEKLAESMRDAGFILHLKAGGEGYGHILHNAFAVGRPVITIKGNYLGKIGERLLDDMETCVCIDGLDADQAVNKIRSVASLERAQAMGKSAYMRFRQVVRFDLEGEEFIKFLGNLQ